MALIMVMVAVFALSVLVGAFAYAMKVETKLAQTANNGETLIWLGRSGVEQAKSILAQVNCRYEALNQKWAGGSGSECETNGAFTDLPMENVPLGDGTFSIKITDLERKININNASEALLAMNPLYISGAIDSWITEIVWDRLMRMDPSGQPVPWAAEKITHVDATTIDAVLRPGQKWHDGKPLTAEDVVFSFMAPASGDKSPMYKPFVANIKGVSVVDARTVRFTLKTPSAAFEASTLAKINLIPKHVWEPILKDLAGKPQNVETVQESIPIGSGPFKVARYKLQEEIVLEANPDYWEKPKMSRWILRVVTNVGATLGMLGRGEINFLTDYRGDPKILSDFAKQNPKIQEVATIDMGFRFLAPNQRRPPFSDPNFRRALSAATNRPLMATAAWNGYAVPATSFISPALKFWSKPGIDDLKFDVGRAKKILGDAGYVLVGNALHYPAGVKETVADN